jgi:hypothetical protein
MNPPITAFILDTRYKGKGKDRKFPILIRVTYDCNARLT